MNVSDGDTITILDQEKTQYKIRLYGIDAPEKSQAFGNVAKQFTSSLTAGKVVDVTVYDTDRYGRTVGVVVVDGVDVNQSIIEAGYAWQYRAYCKASFCDNWTSLEQAARNSKKGLWVDQVPTAPWEWRKTQQNGTASVMTASSDTAITGGYHGNVKSHVFHEPGCRHYDCKNCVKSFSDRQEALNAGYRPCGICKP